MKYPLKSSVKCLYIFLIVLGICLTAFCSYGLYLGITGQEKGTLLGVIFALVFALGLTIAPYDLLRKQDLGYSIEDGCLKVLLSNKQVVQFNLKDMTKYVQHSWNYRELYFRKKKIYISGYYENHQDLIQEIDEYYRIVKNEA